MYHMIFYNINRWHSLLFYNTCCPFLYFTVVQLLSFVHLFATPWIPALWAPCHPLSPWVCSGSCPLSQWRHPTISSSSSFSSSLFPHPLLHIPLLLLSSIFHLLCIDGILSILLCTVENINSKQYKTHLKLGFEKQSLNAIEGVFLRKAL